MIHLGHHQINKVMITQSPPNRSGHMLLMKTNNTALLEYASYSRGTETAKVEGLWLCRDPKLEPKHPDGSNSSSQTPQAWLHSPFYSSLLFCMRDPCDVKL